MPVLFTFLALASHSGAGESAGALAMRLAAEEIGIGVAIGVGFAVGAAWALRWTARRGWLEPNDVLNSKTAAELLKWLSSRRRGE